MTFLPKPKKSKCKQSRKVIQAYSVKLSSVGKKICSIERGANATLRREAAIKAAIWVLVTRGYGQHCLVTEVNKFLPRRWWFHYEKELRLVTGGLDYLLLRMGKGCVIPPGSLGAWAPDLWAGLQMGGAFYKSSRGGSWRTAPIKDRPALGLALQGGCPFHMKVKKWHSSWGECIKMNGLWATYLGADEPGGVGVLRGILCGARLIRHEGRTWAGVPPRGGIVEIADGLGVPYIKLGRGGKAALLFSPFWGALLSPDMPEELGAWYRGWHFNKAGMCPLLPWIFLRGAWGWKLSDRSRSFPSGIVPGLVSRVALWESGQKVSGMMEAGLRGLGVTRVDSRMREAWLRWMEWKGIKKGDFRKGKVPAGLIEPLGLVPLANLDSCSDAPTE